MCVRAGALNNSLDVTLPTSENLPNQNSRADLNVISEHTPLRNLSPTNGI
jgi:hypothetical protein